MVASLMMYTLNCRLLTIYAENTHQHIHHVLVDYVVLTPQQVGVVNSPCVKDGKYYVAAKTESYDKKAL